MTGILLIRGSRNFEKINSSSINVIHSDSTKNWEYGPGAPVGEASSALLETPTDLLIKCQVRGDEKEKENYDTLNKSVFMDTP